MSTSLDWTLTIVPQGGGQAPACRTVGSRDAAVERPGRDSQRVLHAGACRPTQRRTRRFSVLAKLTNC